MKGEEVGFIILPHAAFCLFCSVCRWWVENQQHNPWYGTGDVFCALHPWYGTCDVRCCDVLCHHHVCVLAMILYLWWVFLPHTPQVIVCFITRAHVVQLADTWLSYLSKYFAISCCIIRAHVLRLAAHDRASLVHVYFLPHVQVVSLAPSWRWAGCEPYSFSPVVSMVEFIMSLCEMDSSVELQNHPLYNHMNVEARTLPKKGGGM